MISYVLEALRSWALDQPGKPAELCIVVRKFNVELSIRQHGGIHFPKTAKSLDTSSRCI